MAYERLVNEWPGIFIIITTISCNVTAQAFKFFIHRWRTKEWSLTALLTTGGMPSSHTAAMIGLAVSVGIICGINSVEFAIAAVLAGVVIHDALGIRRHAGIQAKMLNRIIADVQELGDSIAQGGVFDNPAYDKKLKELLGHEPIEVLGGILYGAVMSVIVFGIFMLFLSF